MRDISREGSGIDGGGAPDSPNRRPVRAVNVAYEVAREARAKGHTVPRQPPLFHPMVATNWTQLILPQNLTLPDWASLGEQIVAIADSSGWWLGDWLIYGQETYPDRYRRAMDQTGLDYQTLRNYAWVSRRYIPSRRRLTLSFHHHMEVAAMPESDQNHWLDFAEKMKWSKNELRRQCRAGAEPPTVPEKPQAKIQIQADKGRLAQWRDAAEREQTSLSIWITSVLDEAAAG
jgi:hypothetical protein